MSENKKHIQKKVQGKYRNIKQQSREDKNFDKKEFTILAIIILLIFLLDAIFPTFQKSSFSPNKAFDTEKELRQKDLLDEWRVIE